VKIPCEGWVIIWYLKGEKRHRWPAVMVGLEATYRVESTEREKKQMIKRWERRRGEEGRKEAYRKF